MKFKILRIMSYAAMSEASWLWRYKQTVLKIMCFGKSVFCRKNRDAPIVLNVTVHVNQMILSIKDGPSEA